MRKLKDRLITLLGVNSGWQDSPQVTARGDVAGSHDPRVGGVE